MGLEVRAVRRRRKQVDGDVVLDQGALPLTVLERVVDDWIAASLSVEGPTLGSPTTPR